MITLGLSILISYFLREINYKIKHFFLGKRAAYAVIQ